MQHVASSIPPGSPPPLPAEVANRRSSRRHTVHVRVDLLPLLDAGHRLSPGSARSAIALDLNDRGLLCSRAGYLPLGALLRLFVRLPDAPDDPLACYGRVVRCDLSGLPVYGLQLSCLSLDGTRRIQEYVSRSHGRQRRPPALSWNYRFDGSNRIAPYRAASAFCCL